MIEERSATKGYDEAEFGPHTFRTQNYNPETSIRMLNLLGDLLGESFGGVLGGFISGDVSLSEVRDEVSGDFMAKAVKALFANMGTADGPTVIKKILASTEIRREGPKGAAWLPIKLNRDFQEGGKVELMRMFKVVRWVLEQNYEDFFSEIKDKAGQAIASLKVQGSQS